MMGGVIPINYHEFLMHSRSGHYVGVRIVSLDALMILDGMALPELLEYLLGLVCFDSDQYVSYYISQNLVNIATLNSGIVAEQDWLYREKSGGAGTGLGEAEESVLNTGTVNILKVWKTLKEGLAASPRISKLVEKTLEYDISSNEFLPAKQLFATTG